VACAAAGLARPLLVIHAVDDTIVEVHNGEELFNAAEQPKSFIPLLDTDHLLTDRTAAEHVQRTIVRWLRDTLGR
jgi:uncharacterized protein